MAYIGGGSPAGPSPPTAPTPMGMPAPQLPAVLPPSKFHDVTVVRKKTVGRARVQGVPPEEFGIERQARSIRDCGYCFHRVIRRQSDLIGEGFDEEDVKSLPTYVAQTGTEELARDTVNENTGTGGDKGINTSNRIVRVIEHYVRMDYEQNGKAKLYRVTTGGEIGQLLRRNGKTEIVECDDIPFAAMTPVIVTHRFFGRSIADLIMDIQRVKTALLRGLLDNTYLAVNSRPLVSETDSSDTTIDDLLVSRPGAPIRGKTPNAVTWPNMPPIADKVLPVMEYLDASREYRSGVSRQGSGPDPTALVNQSATVANLAYTSAQSKMKLIARIFAETGVRDMFLLLHETIRKHTQEAQVFRLRNQWINVDPREWKRRDDMTIHVGLGPGGKTEQLAHAMTVAGVQKDLLLGGKTNLVSDQNLYSTAKEVAKAAGFKDVDTYFTDPKTVPPPPPAQPDPKLMIEQMKQQGQQQIEMMKQQHATEQAQLKAQLEMQAQQSDAKHQFMKTQADIALARQKAEFQAQLDMLEHTLHARETEAEINLMHAKAAQGVMHERQKAEKAPPKPDPSHEMLAAVLKHVTAPKRIVRDEHGRVSHVETVMQ